MKEYFSHDYNARNDQSLVKLRMKLGVEGLGIYWCIIEMLYENDGKIILDEIETIAFELRLDSERISDVLKNYKLFKFRTDYFYSDSVNKRLSLRKVKSDKARESALTGWELRRNGDANVKRTHSDGNAIKVKESKVKEKKEKVLRGFEEFWKLYHENIGVAMTDKAPCFKHWDKLSLEEQAKAIEMTPKYAKSVSGQELKYRKKARTYLSDKNFNDEFEVETKISFGK